MVQKRHFLDKIPFGEKLLFTSSRKVKKESRFTKNISLQYFLGKRFSHLHQVVALSKQAKDVSCLSDLA